VGPGQIEQQAEQQRQSDHVEPAGITNDGEAKFAVQVNGRQFGVVKGSHVFACGALALGTGYANFSIAVRVAGLCAGRGRKGFPCRSSCPSLGLGGYGRRWK